MSGIIKYCLGEFTGENNTSPENISGKILTIPNAITMAGVVLASVYIVQFSINLWTWFIPLNIILIGLSDLFDGYVATLCKQHSWIGKVLDGFRDRLLCVSILLNFIVVSFNITICILIVLLALFELHILRMNYIAVRKLRICDVHTASKIRQFIHVICGLMFVVQQYWFSKVVVSCEFLLILMVLGSISTIVHSKRKTCLLMETAQAS